MKNREKLMQQIAEMSDGELADKLCQFHDWRYGDCPANKYCINDVIGFEMWLREEADNDKD